MSTIKLSLAGRRLSARPQHISAVQQPIAPESRTDYGNVTRAAAAFTAATAMVFGVAGIANAVPDQPGTTDLPGQAGVVPTPEAQQAGVSSEPVPPPRPQEHSALGDLIQDPPAYYPSQYRYAPRRSSAPGLAADLGHLHAPAPVVAPKVIVPPPPDRLGLGAATVLRPEWFPVDAAWKVNGQIAAWQRTTNGFLQSVGVNAGRADVMSAGMVLGGASGMCVGAVGAGIPAAAVGAVGGGLIGGTIGGVVGAAAGTVVPIPVVGTVTSGVAGTAAGAAAGAALGAAALGVPAALAGGVVGAGVGATAGAVAAAGDGSEYVAPPQTPPAPVPSLHDQLAGQAVVAINAGQQAVRGIEARPGGVPALNAALSAGAAVQAQPWAQQAGAAANQAARNAVAAAKAAPQTSQFAAAAAQVIGEQKPFTPGQFGVLTDAANGALANLKGVVR